MIDPLPFPPLNAKRTRARVQRIIDAQDRAAMEGDKLAYCRPDPMLAALTAHLDYLATR